MAHTSDGVLADVAPGDLVEVTNGEEKVRGRLIFYTGEMFVGQAGRSLRYYRDHGFDLTVVERSKHIPYPPRPADLA